MDNQIKNDTNFDNINLSVFTIKELKQMLREYNLHYHIPAISKMKRPELEKTVRDFMRFLNGLTYGKDTPITFNNSLINRKIKDNREFVVRDRAQEGYEEVNDLRKLQQNLDKENQKRKKKGLKRLVIKDYVNPDTAKSKLEKSNLFDTLKKKQEKANFEIQLGNILSKKKDKIELDKKTMKDLEAKPSFNFWKNKKADVLAPQIQKVYEQPIIGKVKKPTKKQQEELKRKEERDKYLSQFEL